MEENRKKRYPSDRLRLHALLERKEKELASLQEEVEEIQKLVRQADATAINATAEMYHVTPEQLAEIMREKFGSRSKPVPDLPPGITAAASEEKEGSMDDEEA